MSNTAFSSAPACDECDWTDPSFYACYADRMMAGCSLGGNHIHMTCTRCGFAWVMDPKPA